MTTKEVLTSTDENKRTPSRISDRDLSRIEVWVGNNGMAIRVAFVVILAAFILTIFSAANAKDVDLATVEKSLKKTTDITDVMKKMGERELLQFTGLNANDYEQFIYYRNTVALAVDELLIVKVSDTEDMDEIEEAVGTRMTTQLKYFDNYGPQQCVLLKNAIRTKKGNYYCYCVAENASKYEEVLLDAIQ